MVDPEHVAFGEGGMDSIVQGSGAGLVVSVGLLDHDPAGPAVDRAIEAGGRQVVHDGREGLRRGRQVEQAVAVVEELGQPPVGLEIVIGPAEVLDVSGDTVGGEHLRVEGEPLSELLRRQGGTTDADQAQRPLDPTVTHQVGQGWHQLALGEIP